ncbi:DUF2505 domain-containing protein [Aquipuribacter sp. SD81]|uniref:DUF2505 domain-containing protein n=1 Tax=Aquipuribacter sp. SD81 TaxID=3127703 RepID=UPI0030185797
MTTTLRWPASPDDVVAARLDEDFLAEVCRRTGALEHSVAVDGLRTVVTRVMPTDRFPDFARRLTGERLSLTETTTWAPDAQPDGARTGVIELEVAGAPVRARFTTAVRPAGGGAEEHVQGEVTAKVPLVGGRVEKAVVPGIEAALAAQVDTYEAWRGRG